MTLCKQWCISLCNYIHGLSHGTWPVCYWTLAVSLCRWLCVADTGTTIGSVHTRGLISFDIALVLGLSCHRNMFKSVALSSEWSLQGTEGRGFFHAVIFDSQREVTEVTLSQYADFWCVISQSKLEPNNEHVIFETSWDAANITNLKVVASKVSAIPYLG